MTQEQKDEFLMLYLELIDEADLMRKRGFNQKSAELDAQAEGMRTALEVFGYVLQDHFNQVIGGNEIVIVKG